MKSIIFYVLVIMGFLAMLVALGVALLDNTRTGTLPIVIAVIGAACTQIGTIFVAIETITHIQKSGETE